VSGKARLAYVTNQFVIACHPEDIEFRVREYVGRWWPKLGPVLAGKVATVAYRDKHEQVVAYFTAAELHRYIDRVTARRE